MWVTPLLTSFHPETVFFRPGGVNLLAYLCGYFPHPDLLPEGEGILFSLSLRERVAKGRVRDLRATP